MSPVSRAAYQRYLRWKKNPIGCHKDGRLMVYYLRPLGSDAKRFVTDLLLKLHEQTVRRMNGWPPLP